MNDIINVIKQIIPCNKIEIKDNTISLFDIVNNDNQEVMSGTLIIKDLKTDILRKQYTYMKGNIGFNKISITMNKKNNRILESIYEPTIHTFCNISELNKSFHYIDKTIVDQDKVKDFLLQRNMRLFLDEN